MAVKGSDGLQEAIAALKEGRGRNDANEACPLVLGSLTALTTRCGADRRASTVSTPPETKIDTALELLWHQRTRPMATDAASAGSTR